MIRLLFTSDIRDILVAARDTHLFTGYLLARGYDATIGSTFKALLETTPWKATGPESAPWRVVAHALDC